VSVPFNKLKVVASSAPILPVDDLLSRQLFSPLELVPYRDDVLWQIHHGVVRTMTWSEEGVLIILGYWGPGDIVGHSLSRFQPYQIQCLTSVEMSVLPKTQWHLVLDSVVSHIQQTQELLRIVHQNPLEQRLWQFLVWFEQRFGCDTEQGRLIDLKLLTHEYIAAALNTTRVTVTRLMQQFESEGLLRRHKRRLFLCRR